MKRLTKLPPPAVLINNRDTWTADVVALREGNEAIPRVAETRYNHPDVKRLLRAETRDKCAYCESAVPHAQPGDVEHIRPKSRHPELMFEWTNLTLACRSCNQWKGDYDEHNPLVNPYIDDPTEFFRCFGPLIEGSDEGGRGALTRAQVRLNRIELLERRVAAVSRLTPLLQVWRRTRDSALKAAWAIELTEAVSDDAEYTLVLRAYLEHHGVELPPATGPA